MQKAAIVERQLRFQKFVPDPSVFFFYVGMGGWALRGHVTGRR